MSLAKRLGLRGLLCGLGALLVGACTSGAAEFNEGQSALKSGKLAKAIRSFATATRKNPSFGEAYYNLGAARYRLAVQLLSKAIRKHGSASLKQALSAPAKKVTAARLQIAADLAKLPGETTSRAMKLLKRSFADKLRARKLFRAGKWVVIKKPADRKRVLAQLDRLVKVHAKLLGAKHADHGELLLALAFPAISGLDPKPRAKPPKKPAAEPEEKP